MTPLSAEGETVGTVVSDFLFRKVQLKSNFESSIGVKLYPSAAAGATL